MSGTRQAVDQSSNAQVDGPPARFAIAESFDLDHYRSQPGKWDVRVSQLGRGEFHTKVRCIELADLIIYQNRWDCASMVHGQSPTDWVMFGTSIDPNRGLFHWCGRAADRRTFACTTERGEVEFNMRADSRSIILLIKRNLLEKTIGPDAAELLSRCKHLDSEAAGDNLVNTALGFIDYFESQPALLQHPAIVQQIRSSMLCALAACFPDAGDWRKATRSAKERALNMALDYVRQTDGTGSAWQMSQVAGVSQKSLEVWFREILGMTPGKYLSIYRLNGVRRQLAESEANDQLVADAAADWGFAHLGRFSKSYSQLFGELPSATLRREIET